LKDKIKGLILLQDCDDRIIKVEAKKKEGPLKIRSLEDHFNGSEKLFQEKQARLESLKKERRGMEQRVQDLENKVEKSHVKLSNIKSNKEYAAALKEIEDLGREKDMEEDKILQVMEEIESLEEECRKCKDEQVTLKNQFETDRKDIEKEIVLLNEELALLKKERAKYMDAIDKDLQKKYILIKEKKGGIAIGQVIHGVCQSCNMGIPPQQFNELKKCDELLSCPNCHRLIYWGEDEFFLRDC
jgi:predicted  nucleic acid-binding Zn-ribbon protein